ncbi:MAG: hypothetical protein IB617_02930 [Candidatus Nealsonbacteria bacterium]|nr:MAG: hypothetical protein IB617_02930 [Candidatus Nealsonbacteria bacterium]
MSFKPERGHFREEEERIKEKNTEEEGKKKRKKELYKAYKASVVVPEAMKGIRTGKGFKFKEVERVVKKKVEDREKMLKEIKEKRKEKEKEKV